MNKAYRYLIYPTVEQKILFAKTFGCVRYIYNRMLSDRQAYYKQTGKTLKPTPARYKKEQEWLKEVDSLALANAQLHLEKAYSNFFKNPHFFGFPQYKTKKDSRQSYTTNKVGNNIHFEGSYLILPKVGAVRVELHRQAPADWKLKSVTVSYDNDGRYYVSVLYDYDVEPITKPLDKNNAIGLDFKPSCLYADSNGDFGGMPKYAKASAKKIAKEQRRLAKKKKYSNNYKKQRQKVNKLHKRAANQRKDFLHKRSLAIAKQYDYVCIQKEHISGKVKSMPYKNYRKSVYDCGWYGFTQMLAYKQADRGHKLYIVDEDFASTQICSKCGYKNPALANNLTIRKWECPCCHTKHDRDVNAAVNILKEGLKQAA